MSSSVKAILKELGLSPRKALGQHFLTSCTALSSILAAAEIKPRTHVIEIGPGLGILTTGLSNLGARVQAIELDVEMARALTEMFDDDPNVSIIQGDARQIKIDEWISPQEEYIVVANLPYYAARFIIRQFLESHHRPKRMVVTVQREVAEEMTAHSGRLSLLSVGIQFYARAKIITLVPPVAFYPPPKVTSAIVTLDVLDDPVLARPHWKGFFTLVRAGFNTPRKQLRGAMSLALGKPADCVADLLREGGVDSTRRAETLAIEEWVELYRAFERTGWLS